MKSNVLEGFISVAWLFWPISYAEQVHATNHFKALGNLGKTEDNLVAAIGGETHEVEEMYPAYQVVAELQEEKAAVRTNKWALEAEKVHAGMYEMARQAVLAGRDAEIGEVYICGVRLDGGRRAAREVPSLCS